MDPHEQAVESSDDEFYDAEDGLEQDSDLTFSLSGSKNIFKLTKAIDIGHLMNENGTEFEIQEADSFNNFYQNSSGNKGIFSKPGNFQDKSIENIDLSFKDVEKNMFSITNCQGIKKLVTKHGMGTTIQPGQKVRIHYMIILEGTDEPIDDSKIRKQSLQFEIGNGSVIPVIDLGVQTMLLNETAKFLAEPEFAFGPLGSPPRIPQNARAMVTIQVLKVLDTLNLSIQEMKSEERANVPSTKLFEAALQLKNEGNTQFKKQMYIKAMKRYKIGTKILRDIVSRDKNEFIKKSQTLCTLYTNLAQCQIKVERFEDAIRTCQLALALQNIPIIQQRKVYYRYAKALFANGRAKEAKDLLESSDVRLLDYFDEDVQQLYQEIKNQIKLDELESKKLAQKMFALKC